MVSPRSPPPPEDGAGGTTPGGGATGGEERRGAARSGGIRAELRQVSGGGGSGAASGSPSGAGSRGSAVPSEEDRRTALGVRPMEVLTGSGLTRSTDGNYTDRILARMRRDPSLRFVDAARLVSEGNRSRDDPSRSPRIGDPSVLDDGVVVRYALVLANSDYRTEDDLPEIRTQTRPGGGLRRALERDYGRESVRVESDRTADQMRAAIQSAIDTVAGRLAPGQRGQLMVNFQGHGGATGMEGVDGNDLLLSQISALALAAQRRRVEVVVVSDACFQGATAVVGSGLASHWLDARADASGMNPEEARRVHQELEAFREVMRLLARIRGRLEAMDRYLLTGRAHRPWTEVRSDLDEVRWQFLLHGERILEGERYLSGAVARRLEALRREIGTLEIPEHGGEAARNLCRHLRDEIGSVMDAVTEEIARAMEAIDLAVALESAP